MPDTSAKPSLKPGKVKAAKGPASSRSGDPKAAKAGGKSTTDKSPKEEGSKKVKGEASARDKKKSSKGSGTPRASARADPTPRAAAAAGTSELPPDEALASEVPCDVGEAYTPGGSKVNLPPLPIGALESGDPPLVVPETIDEVDEDAEAALPSAPPPAPAAKIAGADGASSAPADEAAEALQAVDISEAAESAPPAESAGAAAAGGDVGGEDTGEASAAANEGAAAPAAEAEAAAPAAVAAAAPAAPVVAPEPEASAKPPRPQEEMNAGWDEPGPPVLASTKAAVAAAAPLIEAAAEESALEAAEDEKYADKQEAAWTECEGESMEAVLTVDEENGGQSPIRLLDARFLITLAKSGGTLARRQDLPDGAFFDLPRLKRESWGYGGASLRVLVVFQPWLQPDHPDPKGWQLKLLGQILESFVADDGGSYAIYLSYCSLMQPGPDGEQRSPAEAKLCEAALGGLCELFCHDGTWLLEMTSLPPDYPDKYEIAEGADPVRVDFHERGWNFAESMGTKLAKNATMILDCSKFTAPEGEDVEAPFLEDVVEECKGTRRPPLTIDDFRAALETKAFTREKDYEVACYLYKNCFDRKFRPGGAHVYDQLGWGDKEVLAMCKVLESEPFPECKQLWCSHNAITDVGMNRLCEMLGKGAIGSLETLALYGNPESTEPVKQRLRDARAGLEVFFSVKVSTGGRENGRA